MCITAMSIIKYHDFLLHVALSVTLKQQHCRLIIPALNALCMMHRHYCQFSIIMHNTAVSWSYIYWHTEVKLDKNKTSILCLQYCMAQSSIMRFTYKYLANICTKTEISSRQSCWNVIMKKYKIIINRFYIKSLAKEPVWYQHVGVNVERTGTILVTCITQNTTLTLFTLQGEMLSKL